MAKKPKIVSLETTCSACPSQWEGVTKEDEGVYIRYRYGCLTAHVDGMPVFQKDVGDMLSGVMDTEQMKRHLRKTFRFP